MKADLPRRKGTGRTAVLFVRPDYISNKGIAEQGSHEELMAMKGLYYALNQ